MPIRILPGELVDQIAAGEVIERPASVVKELVENALDAGATHIEIDIERGGVALVRVRDDGCGIAAGELPMALARHATSKIACLDDLETVTTLGFRGEALPSIGPASRLRIVSRAAGAEHAAQVDVEGGALTAVRPAAHPPGTTIEVRELFFNVPARRKFVRSDATELTHIARLVERLVLSRFDVSFRLRHGTRVLLDAPAVDGAGADLSRLEVVLGQDFPADALARAARPTVLVREWPQRAGPAADERRQARVPRRALSRPPRRLCALPDARSEARRRERPPGQARSASPRQPPDSRLRVSRRGTRPGRHQAGSGRRLCRPGCRRAGRRLRRGSRRRGGARRARSEPAALPALARSVGDRSFGARRGTTSRYGTRATARRLYPRAESRGTGAGGHARGARARAVREIQGRARQWHARFPAPAGTAGHRAQGARAQRAPGAARGVGAGGFRARCARLHAARHAPRAGDAQVGRNLADRHLTGARPHAGGRHAPPRGCR